MSYLHYAHLLPNSFRVSVGKIYEPKTVIARVGKSGTRIAHCHFELRKDLYGGYNYYPVWRPTWFVKEHYENPLVYFAKPGIVKPMVWTHLGYGWLSWVGNAFHPGVDLNRGGGDADLGDPVYLTQRAKCVAVLPDYTPDTNSYGWHLYFEPVAGEKPLIERVNEALQVAGSLVEPVRSDYWQARVANGDKVNFLDLVNGIKFRMVNKLYPHEDGR